MNTDLQQIDTALTAFKTVDARICAPCAPARFTAPAACAAKAAPCITAKWK